MSSVYDKGFFEDRQDGSYKSAQEIIPILLEVVSPKSVIDIGCGLGSWLNVFENTYNVPKVTGVDGDYVNKKMLQIKESDFFSYDLTQVYNCNEKYDVAMSLEVGEHLPEECADNLIETLIQASDIVMFSAAIPGQIGTNHINEQYIEYWANKFIAKGYTPIDYLRKKVWNNANVDWWYKQNTILYIKNEVYAEKYATKLDVYKEQTDVNFLTRIHPDMVSYFVEKFKQLQTYSGFARYKLYPIKKMLK